MRVFVAIGAGPVNLAWHVYFKHYKDPRDLSYALAPIFNKEMKDLVAAGATRVGDHGLADGFTWTVLADPHGNQFCVSAAHGD